MGEAELQRRAEQLLDEHGVLWHHCAHPQRCRGPRGFPDLIAAGPCGFLAAELKAPGGSRSAGQVKWGYTLTAAGVAYMTLTPVQLDQLAAAAAVLAGGR